MGAGTCAQIAPEIFHERRDGTWAVKEEQPNFPDTIVFDGEKGPGHGPEGVDGRARVPESLLADVIDAAEQCPGECIFLEV